jgi:hypothetical protein
MKLKRLIDSSSIILWRVKLRYRTQSEIQIRTVSKEEATIGRSTVHSVFFLRLWSFVILSGCGPPEKENAQSEPKLAFLFCQQKKKNDVMRGRHDQCAAVLILVARTES